MEAGLISQANMTRNIAENLEKTSVLIRISTKSIETYSNYTTILPIVNGKNKVLAFLEVNY